MAHVLPFGARLCRALLHLLAWRGWADGIALLLLLALAVYFNRDALLSNRIFFENDTPAFYYPLLERVDQGMDQGVFPLWIRTIFGGFPLFADSEMGMAYPINLLLLINFPAWWAVVLHRAVVFTLGAWFMYAFGRSMGFRPFSAAVSAVAFTYGSFLVAQLHHTNVVNTAIWLPLVFCAIEMALRSHGRRRYQWFVLGGLAVGMGCLAVHVQVVLMTLLAAGSYLVYRIAAGPVLVPLVSLTRPRRFVVRLWVAHLNVWRIILARLAALTAGAGLVVGLGLFAGAVQLLPLVELAQFSYRGMRVDYGFAATYALPQLGLLQVVAPYLFKTTAGAWWAPQANWETALYLGAPVLILAVVGAGMARTRHSFFFLGLTIVALLVAMGPNVPLNLHRQLWELPGFSAMRAPGRFTLLAVFGAAALAGWGCHWLDQRLSRSRLRPGPVRLRGLDGGIAAVVFGVVSMLPLLLGFGVVSARTWLDNHRAEGLKALASGEWGVRVAGSTPQSVAAALDGMRWALDITNPALVATLFMAQLTVVLLGVWIVAPRLGHLCKGALLGLVVVDLLGFASAYHPLTSLGDLSTPSGVAAFFIDQGNGERIFPKPNVRSLDANRLVPYRIPTLTGYSSLPQQRQLAYLNYLQTGYDTVPATLLDTAGVRYLVREARFPGLPFYKFVSIDPGGPLALGSVNNAGSRATFAGEDGRGDTLTIITALRHGVEIPQDTAVAEVTFVTPTGERRTVPIKAGKDTAEWAYDRPDVVSKVKHRRSEVAMTLDQTDSDANKYKVNLYYAEIPVGAPITARSVEYRYLYPLGALRLYGMALLDRRTGAFTQIRNKTQYRLVYRDQEALVYENLNALPHAYLVRHATTPPAASGILDQMLEGSFDPRRSVILEARGPGAGPRDLLVSENPAIADPAGTGFTPARVLRYGPNDALIGYTAADPGFLVFGDAYYPGWKAYLDGDPTQIYRANYLFRGVRVPAGTHQVEFRFEPESLRLGLTMTALGLLTGLLVLVCPELWALIRLLAKLAARVRSGANKGVTMQS